MNNNQSSTKQNQKYTKIPSIFKLRKHPSINRLALNTLAEGSQMPHEHCTTGVCVCVCLVYALAMRTNARCILVWRGLALLFLCWCVIIILFVRRLIAKLLECLSYFFFCVALCIWRIVLLIRGFHITDET